MTEFSPEVVELARTVERILAEDGPATEVQLAERLEVAGLLPGLEPGYDLTDVLDQVVESALPLGDGRWVELPSLLRGRVFTHRVSAEELAYDVLRIDGDFLALSILLEDERYRRLADGTQMRQVVLPFDSALLTERGAPVDAFGQTVLLLLAPGRLAALGLAPGGLLAMSLGADGIALTAVDGDLQPAAGLGAALAEAVPPDAEPALYDQTMWAVLTDHPDLLTAPAAPLEKTLADLGYVKDGDWLAPPGFDFAGWRTERRLEHVHETYDLGDDEAVAVLAVVDLYERVADLYDAAVAADRSGDEAQKAAVLAALDTASTAVDAPAAGAGGWTVRDALGLLDEPAVVAAVLTETELRGPAGAGALGMFAQTLEEFAPRPARPALRWLQAKAYERVGALAEAEQAFAAAESLDDSWPLALYDLARYASDRGDAERGLSLLRRAGAPADEPLLGLLERFRAGPRTDIGRNDRCWCGSGRKYKQCHLHREQLPLEVRAGWLYEKAAMSTREARGPDLVLDLADERSRYSDAPDALVAALDDPLVRDAVLFEGGVFLDFLAARGPLLPEDERELAEQWLLAERSVYEVVEVRPGASLRARDVRTGEVHDVQLPAGGGQLHPGELFCARITRVGEAMQLVGGFVPVPARGCDELITLLDANPDPRDLVALLTRMQMLDQALGASV
ncbi:MAG TPA: SEC-C domain-containing protein [Jatrophihabitans sp.]|nr:SEC-C domain-containing protein [Jatrophihabitans sp.]